MWLNMSNSDPNLGFPAIYNRSCVHVSPAVYPKCSYSFSSKTRGVAILLLFTPQPTAKLAQSGVSASPFICDFDMMSMSA